MLGRFGTFQCWTFGSLLGLDLQMQPHFPRVSLKFGTQALHIPVWQSLSVLFGGGRDGLLLIMEICILCWLYMSNTMHRE